MTWLLETIFKKIFFSFRNLRAFFAILMLDTALPSNQKNLHHIQMEVFSSSMMETFLESAPQFILQSSIVLRTGNVSEFMSCF